MSDPSFGARDIPLIPGELYGMRAFTIRDDGTLGPLHRNTDFVFQPGVNEAECDSNPMSVMINTTGIVWTPGIELSWKMKDIFHPNEDSPSIKCTCGFYAYFDGHDSTSFMTLSAYASHQVSGVVRATGKCIVGDLGFRAQKLEIVGLICHEPDDSSQNKFVRWLDETGQSINDRQAKISPVSIFGALALFWLFIVLHLVTDNKIVAFVYESLTLLMWSSIIVQFMGAVHAYRMNKKIKAQPGSVVSDRRARAIRQAYPDVPFYASMQEAKEQIRISKASDLPS